ncbi:8-oxoguanine DNA glycosylase OGG fold protein [Rheinheimera sp. UJ63]|uniref:8-oxoguanine DNA glycosylase OGG fold protein n=1 Tax=Rheinheimera sp. UJ63 TaxID=2910157 RepID=UPI001F19CF05|nr:hypothetical protein [Rheinheimera sp. UJ63]MCF4009595.1 hypothetical protein [Rheinheimera sp. UJ63]
MSNIQTNLMAEFKKIGFYSPVFTLAELQSLFEQNGIWVINGQEYDSKHVRTIFANCSVGPGNRVGESVKRGHLPLFIKCPGKAVYSFYEKSASSDDRHTSVLVQQFKLLVTPQKAKMLSSDCIEKPIELTFLTSSHAEFFAKNMLNLSNETWAGGNVLAFAKYLSEKGFPLNLSDYLNQKLYRKNLFEFVRKNANSTLDCCISILAWGGMNREHALQAFACWSEWEPIAIKIRSGELTRSEAYNAFSELRKSKKLKGLGAAYFTKIIYFLSKSEYRGYIMDQWTARSSNLLLNTKLIELTKTTLKYGKLSYFVSDKNSAETYEKFCLFVEHLAQVYQTTPDLIEMSLFSQGYGMGKWRNYVIAQDSYLYS